MKARPPKLRWVALALALFFFWKWTAPPPVLAPDGQAPEESLPALKAPPSAKIIPSPRERIVLETPTPDAVAVVAAAATPVPRRSPVARAAGSVLESVAFKNEEEVLESLGLPDEKWEHEDRVSWYYSRPARSRQGKPVCPEVQFIEDEARMVIMWPPETMREKIAAARRAKAEGEGKGGAPSTFTFVDSFKYLGVGTPRETVLADLGEPDSRKTVEGKEAWDYDTLIVENGASRRLTVLFQKGKVSEILGR